jgi:hypothetical protein
VSLIFVLIGLLFLGVWFVIRWHRLQQALQWWYRQHVLRLFNEAEAVRNGILQDAFTLRRTLELSSVPHQAVPAELHAVLIAGADRETLLKTLEELHGSLKRFSDFLSPPYLEDSFPLAIDHLLKFYQQQHSNVALELSIPENWQDDAYEQSRIVWIAIDELLRMTLAPFPSVRSISACLTQNAAAHQLVIKIFYSNCDRQNLRDGFKELSYLRRSAQFLTAGTCTYHQDHEALIWSMRW